MHNVTNFQEAQTQHWSWAFASTSSLQMTGHTSKIVPAIGNNFQFVKSYKEATSSQEDFLRTLTFSWNCGPQKAKRK